MSNYENLDEGNVIRVKNFIFDNNSLDHAWKDGRLCFVLHTDDNFKYVVPITSNSKVEHRISYYKIDESSVDYYKDRFTNEYNRFNGRSNFNANKIKKLDVHGYINLNKIYRLPNCYYDQVGKISYEEYKNILLRLKEIKHQELSETIKDAFTPRR